MHNVRPFNDCFIANFTPIVPEKEFFLIGLYFMEVWTCRRMMMMLVIRLKRSHHIPSLVLQIIIVRPRRSLMQFTDAKNNGFSFGFHYFSSFYRAMHFSAKPGIAIACRLSVCL